MAIQPHIIIHGGAGNITRETLSCKAYASYKDSLLSILSSACAALARPGAKALDVATYAVTLLEDDPLFNAGRGAVFTRDASNELESSIMVSSSGYRKRGVGCMTLKHVKNPIKLAREMLVRGEEVAGGGAYSHCQLSGEPLERLAQAWGLEMVEQEYFFTQRRWDEHRRGLEKEKEKEKEKVFDEEGLCRVETTSTWDDPSWDGHEYLPQGTVGAVVLDSFGTICVATSTGGLTNKVPGRIGDTPTLGAGFFAEEWLEQSTTPTMIYQPSLAPPHPKTPSSHIDRLSRGDLSGLIKACLPQALKPETSHQPGSSSPLLSEAKTADIFSNGRRHAVAMSGTGNGDSFLRISAVRTASAMSRFSTPNLPLATAVSRVAGPGGELQRSAGSRWGVSGDGEGGIIGIELIGDEGKVVYDFNCGGMFRAWVDDEGEKRFMVFKDE